MDAGLNPHIPTRNRCAIALFESRFDDSRESDFEDLRTPSATSDYSPSDLDPKPYIHSPPPSRGSSLASVDSDGEGEEAEEVNRELGNGSARGHGKKSEERKISTVRYEDLRRELPNMERDVNEEILKEVSPVRPGRARQMGGLKRRMTTS